jgi:hypothetical protein
MHTTIIVVTWLNRTVGSTVDAIVEFVVDALMMMLAA